MRVCSICGCEDSTQIREGQVDFAGRPILEHKVTIELRYLKSRAEFTKWLASRHWSFREHLGRAAMFRHICRECLNETAVLTRDIERKKQAELRTENTDQYYVNLCGE